MIITSKEQLDQIRKIIKEEILSKLSLEVETTEDSLCIKLLYDGETVSEVTAD